MYIGITFAVLCFFILRLSQLVVQTFINNVGDAAETSYKNHQYITLDNRKRDLYIVCFLFRPICSRVNEPIEE